MNVFSQSHRNTLLIFTLMFIAWFAVFQTGFVTAVEIWNISEIFTHCFLILPCSFYFIYQKREALAATPFKANYWLLPILAGCLFVQLFGAVGDIQLLMHMATFTSLPLLIWMLIGNQAAKVILFPLAMILFAIPVGEQLVPFLQELTTDLAVPLLQLSHVPIYRNGLYLDIPEGRFLVAEACSGISFLIASIVFGCIYAYVSFSKGYKQFIFVVISVLVPIFANALRVYGIVLTGHLSDMEYAVGADHLIYGGVFYGIIIFILVLIGEQFRDLPIKNKSEETPVLPAEPKSGLNVTFVIIILLMFVGQYIWLKALTSADNNHTPKVTLAAPLFSLQDNNKLWLPSFSSALLSESGTLMHQTQAVNVFIASHHTEASSGELISSLHKLYNSDRWSLIKHYPHYFAEIDKHVVITQITSPQGKKRIIVHWYEISGRAFTSQVKAKLYETTLKIFGLGGDNKLLAFSIEKPEPSFDHEIFFAGFFKAQQGKLNQLSVGVKD